MKSPLLFLVISSYMTLSLSAGGTYAPPPNNRIKYNMNYDWKFNKADAANSQTVAFNDAAWKTVSLPHTYNDFDLFDTWITGSGNYGWMGKTWYRKHFKLDASLTGRQVIVEFEGIRQAGEFYINGTWVGRHENSVGPCGVDITNYVNFGATENVLAVKVDNTLAYNEIATGTSFQWDTPPFNPDFGGIVSNVNLHVMDKIAQTLPLYSNLGTTGTYVYAKNINVGAKTADITVSAEVKNTNTTTMLVDYVTVIVDRDGNQVATQTVSSNSLNAGETKTLSTVIPLTNIKFWSPNFPNLYKVFTQLVSDGKVLDVYETPLGVRLLAFNPVEGLTINGDFLYLKGYAPRTTMEWVTVGQAPNWMAEYDFDLIKKSNGNFLRPMHCSPRKRDVEAADKFGIIYACPAGDSELDVTGREWDQRTELMRDVTIFYKNNPSIAFFEGGNQHISPAHMQQMLDIRKQWDPNGGRFSGTRSKDPDLAGIEEYGSTMDTPGTSSTIPVWDAEYARAECPRRVWDKYSPPSFGYTNIVTDLTNTIVEYPVKDFKYNSSEDLVRNNIQKYSERWSLRGGQGLNAVMCGGAKIIFADGCSHGRMTNTEVARVSGAMDAARLPKEAYFAMKAMQSDSAELEIMGHWSYPVNTVKSVFVVSNMDEVSLATYDASGKLITDYGKGIRSNIFEFSFANVAWKSGKIVATGYMSGMAVKSKQIVSAGAPVSLKLTSILGPKGFIADGSDIAMFDVEVVDANGIRVPTQEGTVKFTYSGQGNFLGGYNSGIQYSIFKDSLRTECGINRIFVRATRTAGSFTVNATSPGLTPASATITSKSITLVDGLITERPQSYTITPGDPAIVPLFNFDEVIDAQVNTVITSNATTLSGVLTTQPITIENSSSPASYSINGGAFVSTPGVVSNGDQIRVQITSDAQYVTRQYVTINIGGIKKTFSVTTKVAPKVSPNLAYLKPASASSVQTTYVASNAVDGLTTTRWNGATNVYPQSLTVNLLNEYKIDSIVLAPYASRDYQFMLEGSKDSINWITLSDQTKNTIGATEISVSFTPQTAKWVRVTIEGAATYTGKWSGIYEFKVYQAPADTIPDQFTIVPQTGIDLFSESISAPFTITGIDSPTTISLSDNTEIASFSVNGGLFTTDPSLVKVNDVVRIKLGTGSQNNNTYSVKVTIGGIWADFKVTTKEPLSDIEKLNQLNELTFYPNPTTGIVKISGIDESGNLEIYNVAGQKVMSDAINNSNNYQFNLSDLTPGMYLVKYNTNAKAYHGQIILKSRQ